MTNPVKDKRILLLCAKFFNYDQLVANKLIELGATVDLYDARAELSTLEKAILKYYKGFFYSKLKTYHKSIIDRNKPPENWYRWAWDYHVGGVSWLSVEVQILSESNEYRFRCKGKMLVARRGNGRT